MWTKHACFAGITSKDIPEPKPAALVRCASDNDGDCVHKECPQLRDGEPAKSGRSCPLYNWEDTSL